ncbi:BMP family protein [Pukyongiella litopenaei]|nr:BMP family protein [Pukyongiella litopenaei]
MLSRRIWMLGSASVVLATGLAVSPYAVHAETPLRVALIMTGPITDGAWAQLAYEGLAELDKRPEFETGYAENVSQANLVQVVQGYADDGYDLIIGHGYEFGSAFVEIAPDYPDQRFFASTFKPEGDIPDNTRYIDMAYFDAAYGAGVLAALLSKEGKAVGFVGGGDNPTQQRMMSTFIGGAEATRPGLTGLGIVTGEYDNASKGSEASAAMIARGADVIWHGANVTGLGAIQGAVAQGATVLGCYSDQTGVAPEAMATSFAMNLGWMVEVVAQSVVDGTFEGGSEWQPPVTEMWSLHAGAAGDHNPDIASDEIWTQFQTVWRGLGDGSIDVETLVK